MNIPVTSAMSLNFRLCVFFSALFVLLCNFVVRCSLASLLLSLMVLNI